MHFLDLPNSSAHPPTDGPEDNVSLSACRPPLSSPHGPLEQLPFPLYQPILHVTLSRVSLPAFRTREYVHSTTTRGQAHQPCQHAFHDDSPSFCCMTAPFITVVTFSLHRRTQSRLLQEGLKPIGAIACVDTNVAATWRRPRQPILVRECIASLYHIQPVLPTLSTWPTPI